MALVPKSPILLSCAREDLAAGVPLEHVRATLARGRGPARRCALFLEGRAVDPDLVETYLSLATARSIETRRVPEGQVDGRMLSTPSRSYEREHSLWHRFRAWCGRLSS